MPHRIYPSLSGFIHQRNKRINKSDVRVTTQDTQLFFKIDMDKAVQTLTEKQWLLLENATSLAQIEPILRQEPMSLNAVTQSIALNPAVISILYSAREGKYRLSGYIPLKLPIPYPVDHDPQAEEMRKAGKLVAIHAIHLGGDNTVKWIIDVKGDNEKMEAIEANGGDILMVDTSLKRSLPRPDPTQSPQHAVIVAYLWEGFSNRGTVPVTLAEKLVEVGGELVSRKGNHVLLERAGENKSERTSS